MPASVIECVEVSKAYSKRVTALKNLTLNISEGMSFGLLGENGAGKSTLVKLINARVYLPLARITSRSSYIRGLVLATGVLRIPAFLLLLALASSYHHFSPPPCTGPGGCIAGATPGNITLGAIGLVANCIVISTLVVTFLKSTDMGVKAPARGRPTASTPPLPLPLCSEGLGNPVEQRVEAGVERWGWVAPCGQPRLGDGEGPSSFSQLDAKR